MTKDQFFKSLKAARRVSTPLVCIRTADPAQAVRRVTRAVTCGIPEQDHPPILDWDIVQGLEAVNAQGLIIRTKVLNDRAPDTIGPVDALVLARQLTEDSVLVYCNAQRFWSEPAVAQGIWNLRDQFKSNGRMLVLLTTPGAVLPDELSQDVLVLDEPLPAVEDLNVILGDTLEAAACPDLDGDGHIRALDALLGLPAFPAEQVLAMSIGKAGLDLDQLWNRKAQQIEQTPGLSVQRSGETFTDIGGCDNVKKFLTAVIHGAEPPRAVVWLDELEKSIAGTGTDTSGVKTEMVGTLLAWMQERNADGCIFIGPPGAAKSAMAKATGNTAGIPTIAFDLGAMQNSLVGASGDRLRAALKVVDAVSNGRSLFLATVNSIGTLPPELRRRFTLGTFMFDLPSPEERRQIWTIYTQKYCPGQEVFDIPDDDGWTGAEIKECCRKAWRLNLTLKESAEYIVPISRSAADQVKSLRQQASGKFISASYPGVYQFQETAPAPRSTGRAFRAIGESK